MPATMTKNKRGPKPKLLPEVHKTIIESLRRGYPITEAARHAGIHPATVFRWVERGRKRKAGPFRAFAEDIADTMRPKPIEARPRHIRRAYERQLTPSEIQILVYREFRRLLDEGRVSDDDALRAVEMICADYDEKVENLSISWAEVQVPWRGR